MMSFDKYLEIQLFDDKNSIDLENGKVFSLLKKMYSLEGILMIISIDNFVIIFNIEKFFNNSGLDRLCHKIY